MTLIYTHVLNRGGRGVRSPADMLGQGSTGPLQRSLREKAIGRSVISRRM
jgi:hypothetical protein